MSCVSILENTLNLTKNWFLCKSNSLELERMKPILKKGFRTFDYPLNSYKNIDYHPIMPAMFAPQKHLIESNGHLSLFHHYHQHLS